MVIKSQISAPFKLELMKQSKYNNTLAISMHDSRSPWGAFSTWSVEHNIYSINQVEVYVLTYKNEQIPSFIIPDVSM